jgi:hypothetical protein
MLKHNLRVLLAWLIPLTCAQAQDWTTRHVNNSTAEATFDIMLGPTGDVIVGHSVPRDAQQLAGLYVSTLPPGAKQFFQISLERAETELTSFAADQSGNIFFAAHAQASGLSIGADLREFGGLRASPHPWADLPAMATIPATAISATGVPAVAVTDPFGQRYLSQFSVKRNEWTLEQISITGNDQPTAFSGNTQSLTFDLDGNPTVGFVDDRLDRLSVFQRSSGSWQNIAIGDLAISEFGTSVAAAPDGDLGYVYVRNVAGGELVFGHHDGISTSEEIVWAGSSRLTARSLAYDSLGNPAVVFSDATDPTGFSPLHLATRDGQGNWQHELLPTDSRVASLAFDAEDNVYVAALSPNGVTLISKNIEPFLSDLTGNGFVDFQDLTILLANWNKNVPVEQGNLVSPDDTPVNFQDLTVLLADWTGPGQAGSPEAALGAQAVPEPSSLMLAFVATFCVCLGRLQTRRAWFRVAGRGRTR